MPNAFFALVLIAFFLPEGIGAEAKNGTQLNVYFQIDPHGEASLTRIGWYQPTVPIVPAVIFRKRDKDARKIQLELLTENGKVISKKVVLASEKIRMVNGKTEKTIESAAMFSKIEKARELRLTLKDALKDERKVWKIHLVTAYISFLFDQYGKGFSKLGCNIQPIESVRAGQDRSVEMMKDLSKKLSDCKGHPTEEGATPEKLSIHVLEILGRLK